MINLEFSIPRATPITTLYRQVFDLGVNARGIKSIEILIPEGHKGLAYMRASTPGMVIIPASGSSSPFIRGDNTTVKATLNKRLEGPPYNLICEGYNLDPFLPHTFVLTIEES